MPTRQRKTRSDSKTTVIKKIITDLNKSNIFDPPIDAKAKNLEAELRENTVDLLIDDKELLSSTTWDYLEKQGYLNHLHDFDEKVKEEPEPKEKKVKEEPEPATLKVVLAVVNDINLILGITPLIDATVDQEEMENSIVEACNHVLSSDKKMLQPATWAYLKKFGLVSHLEEEKNKEKREKAKNKITPGPKKPTKARKDRIESLIEEGEHTSKEILTVLQKEFPEFTPSSHSTVISDSKNPKYNQLSKLTIMNKDTKILSF